MIPALRQRPERLIACAALGALLVSAVGVALAASRRGHLRQSSTPAASDAPVYVSLPSSAAEKMSRLRAASNPGIDTSGAGFDLFTAPRLSFDRVAARYRVASDRQVAAAAAEFPYQLVRLARELYPVQLAGYFVEGDAHTVGFTLAGSPQLKFCQVGELVGERLRLTRFALVRTDASPRMDGIGEGVYPEAELEDEATSQRILLDGRGPALTDRVIGALCRRGTDSRELVVRVGDEIEVGGRSYRVETMDPDAGEVVLVSATSGPVPSKRQTLRIEPGGVSVTTRSAVRSSDGNSAAGP